jgi:hypothetical protein
MDRSRAGLLWTGFEAGRRGAETASRGNPGRKMSALCGRDIVFLAVDYRFPVRGFRQDDW